MKCLSPGLSLLFIFLSLNRSVNGQGTIVFNNLGPANGKVIVSRGPGNYTQLQEDINFELIVYSLGRFSVIYERSWLLSDGTAKGINVGPGLFADPSHSVIVLPGVPPGEARDVTIRGWAGNHTIFGEALNAGAPGGESIGTIVTGTIDAPPKSLESMMSLGLAVIPEPRIVSLAIMGLTLFALNRVKAQSNAS
jgi:hypothetical protein